jgi:hypothetical protein
MSSYELGQPIIELLEETLLEKAQRLQSSFLAAGWDYDHIRNTVALICQMDWDFTWQTGRIAVDLLAKRPYVYNAADWPW